MQAQHRVDELLLPSRYLTSEQEPHRHSDSAKRSLEVLKSFRAEAFSLYEHAEAERAMATRERQARGQEFHRSTLQKKKKKKRYQGTDVKPMFPAVSSVPRIDSNWPMGPEWRGEKDSLLDSYLPPKMAVPTSLPITNDAPQAAIAGDEDGTLERNGHWRYHTTRANIAILSRNRRAISMPDLKQELPTDRDHRRGPLPVRNELPIFRGEGLLLGEHRIEDIMCGVIRSFGAREVWDSSFSYNLLEAFNNTDVLIHGFGRGTQLVPPRDYCAVMTMTIEEDERTGYIAASSALDSLAPEGSNTKTVRSHIDLSGWILQKRLLSRAHMTNLGVVSSPKTPASIGASAEPGTDQEDIERDAIHMSYIIQSDPRGSIPQSFLNHLSLSLPLCLASVINYVNRWGFAPYLLRRGIKRRAPISYGNPPRSFENTVRICSEAWEHKTGVYSAIFVVYKHRALQDMHDEMSVNSHEPTAEEYTVIRFYPPAFGVNGYDVEVKNVEKWSIEIDSEMGLLQAASSAGRTLRTAASLIIPHSGLRSAVPAQVTIRRRTLDDAMDSDEMHRTSQAVLDTANGRTSGAV